MSSPAGGERILAIPGPGSIVGELSMIDGAPRSASVSALRDLKLSFISRTVFDDFGRSDPQLYRHVMVLLAHRLRDTNDALTATSFLSVKGRVARALLSLAEAFGQDVPGGAHPRAAKVTQSDLRPWPASPGKCQPHPEGTGRAVRWSAGSRVIIALDNNRHRARGGVGLARCVPSARPTAPAWTPRVTAWSQGSVAVARTRSPSCTNAGARHDRLAFGDLPISACPPARRPTTTRRVSIRPSRTIARRRPWAVQHRRQRNRGAATSADRTLRGRTAPTRSRESLPTKMRTWPSCVVGLIAVENSRTFPASSPTPTTSTLAG